ncbi:hypothetical protein OOT46_24445 [Aquabacterium sp. A7-Y]|uniref:DUF2946 family protein n=1 Tax=Aquabacterium sp. A7-Y TaxID=1349605 RepID=UPI00223E3246|nr:DUF2946 family protein [Aquabacterium sp. A7-Y]MCW7540976.1 hypothetical protein [Aquabacterium sp. A7-Y]
MRHTTPRRPPLRTLVWLWCAVAAFLLQGAVPLLATLAAEQRGWALVEVCSVYGVRTVVVDQDASGKEKSRLPGQHAGENRCSLTSLVGSVALAMRTAAVHLHAPPQALVELDAARRSLPLDPSRRWLMQRLHAPPVQA